MELEKSKKLAIHISTFASVGLVSTFTYFVIANVLIIREIATPQICSVLAYLLSMVISYLGQKHLTFKAKEKNNGEKLRFSILSVAGIFISYFNLRLTDKMLAIDHIWGVIITCIEVPIMSYIVMKKWVFGK